MVSLTCTSLVKLLRKQMGRRLRILPEPWNKPSMSVNVVRLAVWEYVAGRCWFSHELSGAVASPASCHMPQRNSRKRVAPKVRPDSWGVCVCVPRMSHIPEVSPWLQAGGVLPLMCHPHPCTHLFFSTPIRHTEPTLQVTVFPPFLSLFPLFLFIHSLAYSVQLLPNSSAHFHFIPSVRPWASLS